MLRQRIKHGPFPKGTHSLVQTPRLSVQHIVLTLAPRFRFFSPQSQKFSAKLEQIPKTFYSLSSILVHWQWMSHSKSNHQVSKSTSKLPKDNFFTYIYKQTLGKTFNLIVLIEIYIKIVKYSFYTYYTNT